MSLLTTSLSPLSAGLDSGPTCALGPVERRFRARPPRGFHPVQGVARNVRFGGHVPDNHGRTAAQRAGIAFEVRVHDVLSAIYGVNYRPHPAILYEDNRGHRRAIPDGILRLGSTLVVVEVKLSHTDRAWWQLRRLYIPLLNQLTIPSVRVVGIEICHNFDPDTRWPEPFSFLTSIHALNSGLGVIQWRL